MEENVKGTTKSSASPTLDLQVNIRKGECPLDARLLAALRVLNATNAKEIDNSAIQGLGAWDKPLSVKNEITVLKTLTGLVAIALSSFKTTLDQDVELLAGLGGGGGEEEEEEELNNMRLAIQFRMAKKKLLLEALQTVRKRIEEIGGNKRNGGKGFG
jgi:histone-lysine N-methyltransferase SETD3